MSDDSHILYDVPSGCFSSLVGMFLALLACLLLSLLLSGCKTGKVVTERVEVPVVVTQEHTIESVKIDHIRDTLIQRDSVYHYIKGDTTIIERWHYYTNNNQQVRVDTLVKVDSVQVPVEVVREREVTKVEKVNRLKWWQRLLMGVGGLALIAVCIMAAYKMGKRKE